MRRIRLLAPVGVAGAIALGAWIPSITSASADVPHLAPISADQLLAKAQTSKVTTFSGTVRWTANLGLPSISGLTDVGGQGGGHAFSPTSLLSGNHDITVYANGPGRQRLTLAPTSLSEVNIVHNGNDVYYLDSSTMKVTHYTGVARSGRAAPDQATGGVELTPDQAATKLLANITPSTDVSVGTNAVVAGEKAYQLVLVPKAANSTVGSVTIAVDAANGMPLQVQVTPRGSATPALSLGYVGSIDFSAPAASNFAALQGASTVTKTVDYGAHASHPASDTSSATDPNAPTSLGTDWTTIGVFQMPAGRSSHQLDQVATSVSGSWGSGKLVTTNLLNALVLPDGRVLAGFVTPGALESAASTAG